MNDVQTIRHDPLHHKLQKALRLARKDARMSQEHVAQLMNWPQSCVSKVEKGDRIVNAVELMLLARIYDKDLDYFRVAILG